MEDLDQGRVIAGSAERQLDDLRTLGLDWDGEVVFQSNRHDAYEAAIERLRAGDRLYECFCTRAEIRAAASAPHGPLPEGAYPGTCLRLTAAERRRKRGGGRPPALRVRAGAARIAFTDRLHGAQEGVVDDFVVRRNDGAPAYNLAVIVDDAWQGIGEVVRGDDLLDSTPRQLFLADALGLDAARARARPARARPGRQPAGQAARRGDARRARRRRGPALDGGDARDGGRRDRGGDARALRSRGLGPREPTRWRGSLRPSQSAARTRSGRSGSSRKRTPVAWYTALPTAAAVPTMPISPIPLEPIGFRCGSSSSTHVAPRSSPTSALTATWYWARSWLTKSPNSASIVLSSSSAIDRPIVMPPISCERAVPRVDDPARRRTRRACRATRTSPVSTSTRTSANCAPKAWRASFCSALDVVAAVS